MNRYDKYKPSGIEWIGDIPEHWNRGILKRFVKITDGSHFSPKTTDSGLPYISVKDIGINTIDLVNCKKISDLDFEELSKNGCKPSYGDILLTKDGTIGRAAIVHSKYEPFVVLSSLAILTPSNRINSEFLYNYLISGINIDQMYSVIHGSALTRLTIEKIANLNITLPPLSEQTAIANYLDRKTAEIDELIADKKRLLQLYEEEKSTIISQAVTKGIHTDVSLRNSGIEWLGEIPEHWELKKLRYVLEEKLKYGANESAEQEIQEHPRYIRITDFGSDGKLKNDTFKSLVPEKAKDYLLKEGDILFARSGATVGKTFQFKKYNGIACYAGYLIKAAPNSAIITSDFLYQYTKSGAYEHWKSSIFNQATIQNIGADKYALLEVPVPSIEEQQSIVRYIETECSRIDTQVASNKKLIDLLIEYRTALISEVVTGKIKVTD